MDFSYQAELVKEDLVTNKEERAQKQIIIDDEGIINKRDIAGISRYEDNNFEDLSPDTRPVVEITYCGTNIIFTTKNQKERNTLYTTIRNWLYTT